MTSSHVAPHLDHNRQARNQAASASSSTAPTPSDSDFISPGPSTSGLSFYQPSDYSDIGDDPFLGHEGLNFDDEPGALPSFLEDDAVWNQSAFAVTDNDFSGAVATHRNVKDTSYPLTPEQTASLHTASPRSERREPSSRPHVDILPPSISPQQLQKPFQPHPLRIQPTQLTPSLSSSGRSSEDGLAPATATMHCQSPRVTVSNWDHDDKQNAPTVARTFEDDYSATNSGYHLAGDLISAQGYFDKQAQPTSAPRDTTGQWERDPITGHAGLDPTNRPSDEVPSINELANQQERSRRNSVVSQWLDHESQDVAIPEEKSPEEIRQLETFRHDSTDGIALGDQTENAYKPGQTYYTGNGGEMNDQDREIITQDRNWGDAPLLHQIRTGSAQQPETSQAAIERFQKLCDNESVLSRTATWGTRRRSFTSTRNFEMEGLAGNLLKKLTISQKPERESRPATFLRDLRERVRRSPSISSIRKRRNSGQDRDEQELHREDSGSTLERKESAGSPLLSPPERTTSWTRKNSTPSINTMIASMGSSAASIGTTHTRKASVSGASITSPKLSSVGSLKVVNTIQKRQRSKSAAAAPLNTDSHPNLIGMWKMSGGPPVASISNQKPVNVDAEEEDDDDDEALEDSDMQQNPNLIDNYTPNLAGFQEYVLALNPALAINAPYLVDRIAHQQVVRYKYLLNQKVKHLGQGIRCPCGSLCLALGGQAKVDAKVDGMGMQALATHLGDDEDSGSPLDNTLTPESFPKDIPMPPTQSLPAEFECQLCYKSKKFQKPSDWTKHVHEDVQPFTCTWEKCKDAKSFKRKADWVRHENEGHRHLEWWTCNVDECRHTCYRRDNFLQHLVREHKYPEPRFKTKAAIKKAGSHDPTWYRVDQCHVPTHDRAQDEPCRFCNKSFATWKKLTVHLSKHMEQISLPVLCLVAAKAKELDADTIISPVQDLPPQQMMSFLSSPQAPQVTMHGSQHFGPQPPFPNVGPSMYSGMAHTGQGQPQFHAHNTQYGAMRSSLGMTHLGPAYDQLGQMPELPQAMARQYDATSTTYMNLPNGNGDGLEPFPAIDPLGMSHSNGSHHKLYNGMMDVSTANGSPFSGHGSTSPYSHSPHIGASTSDTNVWDDRQRSGFLG